MAAYYARPVQGGRTPNFEKSGYVLHTTSDPDVFIAEIDTVFDGDGDGDGGEADRAVSSCRSSASGTGRSPACATTSHPG